MNEYLTELIMVEQYGTQLGGSRRDITRFVGINRLLFPEAFRLKSGLAIPCCSRNVRTESARSDKRQIVKHLVRGYQYVLRFGPNRLTRLKCLRNLSQ